MDCFGLVPLYLILKKGVIERNEHMEEDYKSEEYEPTLYDYVEEGKVLVLGYFKKIFDKYKYKYASRAVLKKEADGSKKLLDGVCHTHTRTIKVWESPNKEEILETIVHETLEAIASDMALFNNELQKDGGLRIFKHEEIDKMTDNIMRLYRKSKESQELRDK